MIREEALRWFEEGENDISTANILLENKKYNPSAFYSQQAAEKILKGLLLAITKLNGVILFFHFCEGWLKY